MTTENGWRWGAMGYRSNGDGYGIMVNDITGQRARIGGREALWNPKTETFKIACLRAMARRIAMLKGE